jgi:hypothetical protein
MSRTAAKQSLMSLHISKKYGHFVFGIVQSGLTSVVATGIACLPTRSFGYWATSWLISWVTMVPIVVIAAPWIRRVVQWITLEQQLSK